MSDRARREAAVLVPIYRDPSGDLRIVLLRRAEGGIHGGQLAFPGGVREPSDRTALETALRESEEEIGLDRASVELLQALEIVETRTSNYRIAPFLARIRRPAAWRPDAREVAEVLEPRVRELADPQARGEAIETFATWSEPRMIPFIRVGALRLWGATYRILDPILPGLAAGAWDE